MKRIVRHFISGALVALSGCSGASSTEDITSAQEALACTDTPRSTESCANAKSWGFCGQSWFGNYCQVTCGTCAAATNVPAATAATGGAQSTGGTSISTDAPSSGDAALTITSSSATTYCAKLSLPNKLSKATSNWQAVVDLGGSSITSVTSAAASASTGTVTFGPANSATINPGSSAVFSWCANGNANARPKLSAWNFALDVYQTCNSNNGTNPTMAALAVAMGKELGRWNPSADLYLKDNYIITLTSTGLARCSNGCPNTKAILGQQYLSPSYTSGLFDGTNFVSSLGAAFGRQLTLTENLAKNASSQLPPDHKLTLIAGPTNLGIGACGPHYVFQVDKTDGSSLDSKQAANIANSLCFFGMTATNGTCGGNPYINFVLTSQGCPSGRTCVAIDPTDGDNSTIASTSSGSAVTYPLNRVYDPTGTLLNTLCITTTKKVGSLVSKCSTIPNTCGYDYCVAKY